MPSPEKARAMLEEHAADLRRQIREQQLLKPDCPIDRLEFIAGAIERVLDDKTKSLDKELGLTRRRGRVSSADGQPGKHFQMVLRIVPMVFDGLDWEQIIDQLHEEGEFEFYDGARELEKIYEREKAAAIEWYAEQIRQN